MLSACPVHRFHLPLDAGQHGGDIVCRAPAVLENVEAELARGVDVGMEHLADELDRRRLVGILLLEVHHEPEGAILEGGVGRTDDDSIPGGWLAKSVAARGRRRGRGEGRMALSLSSLTRS